MDTISNSTLILFDFVRLDGFSLLKSGTYKMIGRPDRTAACLYSIWSQNTPQVKSIRFEPKTTYENKGLGPLFVVHKSSRKITKVHRGCSTFVRLFTTVHAPLSSWESRAEVSNV